MKKILLLLSLLTLSIAVSASDSLKSKALAGKYELVKLKGDGADFNCGREIEVTVNKRAVYVRSAYNGSSHASFFSKNSGCQSKEGDVGPLRTTCTRFYKNKVSFSMTEPVTIVGFIREVRSVKLRGKNKLIFKNDTTTIPFGLIGIGDYDDFTCEYVRI